MAVQEGRSIPKAVDGRADLYALGLLLCEALGGALPPPDPEAVSWLRQRNPALPPGLSEILGKCLADDPPERYPHAAALADDLRRQLADQPGRGVVTGNFSERWPWGRRLRMAWLLNVLLAAIAGAVFELAYLGHKAHEARAAPEPQRQAHEAALGLASTPPPDVSVQQTAWEHYVLGRARLRAGNLEAAAALFDQALALEPQAFWPNYFKGQCAYQQANYEDAVLAFTACTVLAPDKAWCFYNRGLVYDAWGQVDRALRDYDRALELDARLAMAAVNRGMLHYRAKHYAKALDDLRRALDGGADPALVHYDRALVQLAQGDRLAAQADLRKALERDPAHKQARALLEKLDAGK
jgi:tetratricopeptide (TPR) repeat protein